MAVFAFVKEDGKNQENLEIKRALSSMKVFSFFRHLKKKIGNECISNTNNLIKKISVLK